MPRIIKYSVATQYNSGPNAGYYNPTYLWGRLQAYMDFWGEYFDLAFQRVNSGAAVSFVQANRHTNPQAWMWTNGRTCYVSPVINYGRNDWLCGMPSNHEMCHWNNVGHLPAGNVMAPSGGRDNYTQLDCQRYLPYPWRSTRRPWSETALMRDRFTNAAMMQGFEGYSTRQEEQHCTMRDNCEIDLPTEYTCCNKPTWTQRLLQYTPLRFRAV